MGIVVQKFGGTSLGDTDKIMNAARKAVKEKESGNQVVVTVSAMSGETNRLLALADAINEAGSPRERDVIASAGEQVSSALMALSIETLGHQSISFNAAQIDMRTDSSFTKAKLQSINAEKIHNELNAGKIVVITGFQGVTDNLEITTLGRGGSDTTAVAIAAVLKADRCDIYTDVDGVYAADPRIVPRARKINAISFEEMLEMASAGSKVLHTRSVQFAATYKVPLQVRSSFDDVPGTMIQEEVPSMENVVVSGISHNTKEAKVTLSRIADQPGTAARLFQFLTDNNINVDMIVQNAGADGLADISFTIEKTDLPYVRQMADKLRDTMNAKEIRFEEKIAKISAIGFGMRSHAGVAARMFKALSSKGINILMISTSEIKISCVIDGDYTELAVRTLCEEFDLEEKSEEEGITIH
jgi:aspartate kinase